ncbi:MAG: hypothetical protein ACK5ME_04585 [Parahaliea sp.]
MNLLEVAVAGAVFSVAVLGQLHIQLRAGQALMDAQQRTQATVLANDLIGRVRANYEAAQHYQAAELGDLSRLLLTPPCLVDCLPHELAALDLQVWEQLLTGQIEANSENRISSPVLVSPRACISYDSGLLAIAIAWRSAADLSPPSSYTGAARCGLDLNLYGENDRRRRLLMVESYVPQR